jgi:hypothetical protein
MFLEMAEQWRRGRLLCPVPQRNATSRSVELHKGHHLASIESRTKQSSQSHAGPRTHKPATSACARALLLQYALQQHTSTPPQQQAAPQLKFSQWVCCHSLPFWPLWLSCLSRSQLRGVRCLPTVSRTAHRDSVASAALLAGKLHELSRRKIDECLTY